MDEDDDESEDEYLARTLREFGLDSRGVGVDVPDDDALPGWDENDLEGWE